MNDQLEQQLRESLHRGSLPPAPDSLREQLSQLPTREPDQGVGRRLANAWSGVRLAALASAAAVALVFVLVVRSLSGPAGAGLGSSPTGLGPGASSASPAPSITPPTPTPAITLGGPAESPSAGPSTPDNFTCAAKTVLPASTSAVTQITDVRVGTHPGYDRIVFEFAGSGRPQLTVAVASPPFVGDASGQPVTVAGSAFLTLKLYDASGYLTYSGPS